MAVMTLAAAMTTEILSVVLLGFAAALFISLTQRNMPQYAFVSARKSLSGIEIALSLTATYMGNWMVILPADFAGNYSLVGALGYIISSLLPIFLYIWLAPSMVKKMSETDFVSTDFYYKRYGRAVHVLLSVFALAIMFFALCAELTTIHQTISSLTYGVVPGYASVLPVAIVTLLYTTYGGLPSSIFTDKLQAIIVIILGIVMFIVCWTSASPPEGYLQDLVLVPENSIIAASVLCLSIYPPEFLNQGAWQRALAAKSTRDLRFGFCLAAVGILVGVALFSWLGIVSKATYPFGGGSIFSLVLPLPLAAQICMLIFAIFLVTSSVDTLQNAMVALMGRDLAQRGYSMHWARVATVFVNVPAIIVASLGLDIFSLFTTANLLGVAVFAPQILSLIPYFTPTAALYSCFVGILSLFTVGWVVKKDFLGGLGFIYVWDISSLPYVIACIVAPVAGALTLLVVSWIERTFFPNSQTVAAVQEAPGNGSKMADVELEEAVIKRSIGAVEDN